MSVSNRGFFLIDALINVVITVSVCFLCFSIYYVIDKQINTYERYQINDNEYYLSLFSSMSYCKPCEANESD